MTEGTLDIISEGGEDWFSIQSSYEIELMISRLIPSHKSAPLRVRVHPENTRLIRMVMSEYPFELPPDKWAKAIGQINQRQELAKQVAKLDYVEPKSGRFIGTLLPFQKQALDFLTKTGGNTMIFDQMGLGKTIQTIAYISENPESLPCVIVSPLVTLVNWKRELEKFLKLDHSFHYQKILLPIENDTPIIHLVRSGENKSLPVADFYIINYDIVGSRAKNLMDVNPKTVVFDEVQYLRNNTTLRYSACRALSFYKTVQHRIGLSGTPIYNKGIEMFNICEIVKPGLLGERDEFIRRYCMPYNGTQTNERGKEGLTKLLRESIMIRRKKQEVLKDLPNKIKMRQTVEIDKSLYYQELEKLYDDIEEAKQALESATLVENESEEKNGLFLLNKKVREMRIKERQIAGLAKAPYVLSYLKALLEDNDEEKFVVFCHHRTVHQILFDGLFHYKPVQVIGGQSDKERQEAIDRFQNGNESRVIICGLRAGNIGINLTNAAYVIFAELDWSPSVHLQAEDRLHRIGQKEQVIAHYLEGEGTFDEIISQKLLSKAVIINEILGDKMERMNNKAAIEFLEGKFKKSTIGTLLQ